MTYIPVGRVHPEGTHPEGLPALLKEFFIDLILSSPTSCWKAVSYMLIRDALPLDCSCYPLTAGRRSTDEQIVYYIHRIRKINLSVTIGIPYP
jgi:hypothetical protein